MPPKARRSGRLAGFKDDDKASANESDDDAESADAFGAGHDEGVDFEDDDDQEHEWDEDAWDEDDEYDDEDEESEEESIEESDTEDDEDGSDTDSNAQDDLSDISNETDADSDFDRAEVERSAAVIFPEPPWAGVTDKLTKLMMSCLLPILLVFLCAYAVCKVLKSFIQCLFDLFSILRRCVLILIVLALSPLIICWRVAVPGYLQSIAYKEYDQRLGRHIRHIGELEHMCLHTIFDLPNILMACFHAAVETCVRPCQNHLGDWVWHFAGQYVYQYGLEPLYDAHFNRLSGIKKKHAMKKEDLAKKKKGGAGAKRRREAREKAKRLRKKRKEHEVEITLALPIQKKEDPAMKEVIRQKQQQELFSRTMVVERRYAVFIGLFWFLTGGTMLVSVVDGDKDETCTICQENVELGFRICRGGIGRDCSFQLHGSEIFVSVGVASVGALLLVYSAFLYHPKSMADEAIATELRQLKAQEERDQGQMKKEEDPESQALTVLLERLEMPTPARRLKGMYERSSCGRIQRKCARFSRYPLRCLFSCEKRHQCQKRSIWLQMFLAHWCAAFVTKCKELILGRAAGTPRTGAKESSMRMARTMTRIAERKSRGKRIWICLVQSICGRTARGLCLKLQETGCGRRCKACAGRLYATCLERFPPARLLADFLGDAFAKVTGTPRGDSARLSGAVVAGRRTQAGSGVATLEDTLLKFGFSIEAEDDGKATEEEVKRADPTAMGLEEVQQEVGCEEWIEEEDDLEDELELVIPEDEDEDFFNTGDQPVGGDSEGEGNSDGQPQEDEEQEEEEEGSDDGEDEDNESDG